MMWRGLHLFKISNDAARLELGRLHFHVYLGEHIQIYQVGWNSDHHYAHKVRVERSPFGDVQLIVS